MEKSKEKEIKFKMDRVQKARLRVMITKIGAAKWVEQAQDADEFTVDDMVLVSDIIREAESFLEYEERRDVVPV